jgi:type IV pilus assembly protein PilP
VEKPPDDRQGADPVFRLMLMVILAGMSVALLGCGIEEPTEVELPPVKRRQEAKAPSLADIFAKSDDESYTYNPTGRRDPFKPLIAAKKPTAVTAPESMTCPPLQDFELASLKLVAIVWGDLGRKAMLKAPNGRGYAVTENMQVGRHCGRVSRIDSHAVFIVERRRDAEGNVSMEEVILRLREGEG